MFFSLWGDNAFKVSLNLPVPFAYGTFIMTHAEWRILRNRTYIDAIGMLNLDFVLECKPLFETKFRGRAQNVCALAQNLCSSTI